MSRRLPLTALRTFDAAARHGSFLKAADELGVTPGAVSRQIKALEAELETRLFDRFNRMVRLTDTGRELADGVARGFDSLAQVVEAARSRRDGPLVVTVMHSMAARWLAPRLHRFEARHPEIQVLLAASDLPADLARDRIDVALRSGTGPYPGLHVTPLIADRIFPVCSPALLASGVRLETPADLAQVTLLHDVKMAFNEPQWPEWLEGAGFAGQVDASRGPQFSNTYLAIEAALAGRGVALAREAMVVGELASGRLVKPFAFVLESPFHHWILSLPEKADQPNIRRFRTWLVAEAQADGLKPPQMS